MVKHPDLFYFRGTRSDLKPIAFPRGRLN